MPLYALICTDKPGALPTRLANREAHLAYIKATGAVLQAGPFLDGAGSLLILDLPDLAAAQAWAAGDPYAKAGLFSAVRLEAWKKVIG